MALISCDRSGILNVNRLSRATLGATEHDLFFAYSTILIPVAMTGSLNPMLAGGAMALSSIFLVMNSSRSRQFRPVTGGWRPY